MLSYILYEVKWNLTELTTRGDCSQLSVVLLCVGFLVLGVVELIDW